MTNQRNIFFKFIFSRSFFAHHFFLIVLFCFSFFAQAQSFTVIRSSIGHHLGSTFANSSGQYKAQQIVGQSIASTSLSIGDHKITQGFIQPLTEATFSDFIDNKLWGIELITYPNPVIQTLFVDVKQQIKRSINILISDTFGRTVLRKNLSETANAHIDVSVLAAGTYLLQAQIGERTIVKRFVKRTNY